MAKKVKSLAPDEQIINKLETLIETDETKLIIDLIQQKVPNAKIRALVGCAMKRVDAVSKILKAKRKS